LGAVIWVDVKKHVFAAVSLIVVHILRVVETASQFLVTASKYSRDNVKTFYDDVKVADSEKPEEDSTENANPLKPLVIEGFKRSISEELEKEFEEEFKEEEDDLEYVVETASQFLVTASKYSRDNVKTFYDDVKVADSEKPEEDSTENANPLKPLVIEGFKRSISEELEKEFEEEFKEEEDDLEYVYTFPTREELNWRNEISEELEKEFEEEFKEEEDDLEYVYTFPTREELKYPEFILKNPRSPWIRAKIRTKNLNNIKIPCMIGQLFKEQAYINLESPVNVMSKLNYHWIMNKELESRKKTIESHKSLQFCRESIGLKAFVGNFTHECDFVVLEDISSVIDHYLGGMVLGKPFVKTSVLAYDKNEGTIMFEKNNERITFKMPHKMERFRNIEDQNTDNIPSFVVASEDDEESNGSFVNRHRRTHYSDCLNLGPEYKHDESVNKTI
nr:protein kinase-like domain, concanavalin A-like lectin/glucanase domain protein [Tanacetum cinerariifolium]